MSDEKSNTGYKVIIFFLFLGLIGSFILGGIALNRSNKATKQVAYTQKNLDTTNYTIAVVQDSFDNLAYRLKQATAAIPNSKDLVFNDELKEAFTKNNATMSSFIQKQNKSMRAEFDRKIAKAMQTEKMQSLKMQSLKKNLVTKSDTTQADSMRISNRQKLEKPKETKTSFWGKFKRKDKTKKPKVEKFQTSPMW